MFRLHFPNIISKQKEGNKCIFNYFTELRKNYLNNFYKSAQFSFNLQVILCKKRLLKARLAFKSLTFFIILENLLIVLSETDDAIYVKLSPRFDESVHG